MARVSIYVSDELKARMAAVGDAINWSDVARPAFEQAIANYNHRKEKKVDTAIERIRATKQAKIRKDEEWGRIEGYKVARDLLIYDQLEAINKIMLDNPFEEPPHDALYKALDPHGQHKRAELNEMYFTNDGEDVSNEFIIGFIEGAQEFFEQVKDQI